MNPVKELPKCVSSAKRASMSDAERKSASRRKKISNPGQQSKSGAANPTYVSTDSPKKKMNENHKAIASGKEKMRKDIWQAQRWIQLIVLLKIKKKY
jgi:hypothetical protein